MGVIAAVLLGLYALPMLWDVQHSAAVARMRAQVDALTSGYAVCTPGRLGVYTVDGEDSQVECVRVQGDVVADVGERGEWLCLVWGGGRRRGGGNEKEADEMNRCYH